MQAERNYFAFCLDKNTRINYFIVPSKYLNPRPKARHLNPGVASDTLGQQFWEFVFQSAWHESLEVDPDDGSFLDQKPKTDEDFEHLLTEAEYKECLVLATASSVQELQQYVPTCKIKVPTEYRRLDDSVASGSKQYDEPQQVNEQFRSSESNQQTSKKDNPTASKSLEESTSATSLEDDTHKRPEGVANLGFFETEMNGRVTRQNADNVCVLVIHYEFINHPKRRNGDASDVENLKTFFGTNRNCKFRDLSPNKNDLLDLLSNDEELLKIFESQDDVPSVFVLFILSHGNANGIISTDHFDGGTQKNEQFSTDEVLDKLQGLKRFQNCLKIVNFGPCRGSLEDSKYDNDVSYTNYENRNSCRITTRPGMHNFVVFYSTVETTMSNRNKVYGSRFVQNICTCLSEADDEPLLKFFTTVQNRIHQTSREKSKGQTAELNMCQRDRKFTISKAKIITNANKKTGWSGGASKVSNVHFSWKSDEGEDIRGRRGFILYVDQSKQVQEMKRALQNLDFEITDWTLNSQSIEFYNTKVFQLKPDVGCILTCIIGPVCENDKKEVCVGQEIPITDILHSLVGPKNDRLIGKPKILFVVDEEAPETDDIADNLKKMQVSATNHSGWLVLILKYEDAMQNLIELLGKIGEKSLQELLEPLLTRESKRDVVLLDSTLQYLIKFPIFPRVFVKPDFKLQKTQIPRDSMVKRPNNTTDISHPIKIDFDKLTVEAEQLMKKNKQSIPNCSENPQTSRDFKPSLDSDLLKDFEANSAARDSADMSILWLFNSVAGAGKSTVLEEMAHQLSKYDGFKILRIPLKDKYQILHEMPFKVDANRFLADATCNSHVNIVNWIKKRELIVFLDGFDEVCPDFREKILQVVIALNSARVPLFVGTRPHEVHYIQDRIKNTTIVEIEPLDEAKQIEFLQIVAQKKQEEIKLLRENFKDKDILGNPLYLTLLAEYSGDGNLYEIFDTIVQRKVKLCLVRENGGKDVGEETINKSLKFIQLVASRFITGVKIDQGSVTKEDLEKMNAFGVVTYCNDRVNFTHQTFAEFLTAQKFLYDLKNPGNEKVPLFNDEFVQVRMFVDLFFSTEKGKDASYTEAFKDCAESIKPLQLFSQIFRENLTQMFKLLNPDLSLKDEEGKNALHFALRHLEMVNMVHEKNSKLATETTNNGENCLHLAIADEKCSEEVALWLLQNTEVDKNAETSLGDTPILLAGAREKWKVAQYLTFSGIEINKVNSKGKSILHYAVRSNNIDLVRALLDRADRAFNVNLKDNYGVTALHLAAGWNNNRDFMKFLFLRCIEGIAQEHQKWTEQHFAAELSPALKFIPLILEIHSKDQREPPKHHLAAGMNSNLEMIKLLLDNGAKINAEDNNKRTALHLAALFNRDPIVVQMLLENGAEVHSQEIVGFTALHLASLINKNTNKIEILLGNGAKVNAKNNNEWTPLHVAARFNSAPEIIQKLLENGADVHSQEKEEGLTALHLAAQENRNPEILSILLDYGATVNAQNNDKWTALHLAAGCNPVAEVVNKLLESGADVHSQTLQGSSAIHLAAGHNSNPEILNILLEKGAKVNAENNDKCTSLHFAAGFNPVSEIVQMLLEIGADVHSKSKNGNTALHIAAKRNKNPEIIKILLDSGSIVNAQDNDKWTALHLAARYNPVREIVEMLLENGADINSQIQDGETALHLAAGWNKNPELVQILLEKGANVNAQNNKNWTGLHLAARYNPASEIVFKLLENGADVHSQIQDGSSALHLASGHNTNPGLVQILLEKGANVNAQNNKNWTALHFAARYNPASEIVFKLLENGADVHSQCNDGNTALHLAAGFNKNAEIVKSLLEKGANVDVQNDKKLTALHLAAGNNPTAEVIKKLLENGAEVDSQMQDGSSALQLAAGFTENPEIVKILLEKGAKVNAQNNCKVTALHLAAEKNQNAEVIQKLLENGADVHLQDKQGSTALHQAAGSNTNPEIVKILLLKSAKVNARDNEKRTALHYAIENNQVAEIVQMLLEKGANIHSKDKDGSSALHLAARCNENPRILKLLLEKRAEVNARDNYNWTALHFAAKFCPTSEVVDNLIYKGAEINAENDEGETALFLALKHNPVTELAQKLIDHGAEVNKKIRNDKDCFDVLRQMKENPGIIIQPNENDSDGFLTYWRVPIIITIIIGITITIIIDIIYREYAFGNDSIYNKYNYGGISLDNVFKILLLLVVILAIFLLVLKKISSNHYN